MPMLDFQQIKLDFPIMGVAERLGLELKKNGAAYRCACPSGDGNERGFVITPAKGAWYSFPAQKGGDVISLVSFVNRVSAKDAAAWILGDTTEPEKKKKRDQPVQKEGVEKPSDGFQPLPYLVPDHEAIVAIGFPTDFAAELGIGYSPRGVMRGCIAVPVRDSNGKLRGYIGVTECRLPTSWHD